jgi:hypothetical protein
MTFDECFDERTERQNGETSRAGVLQSKPDQPIAESDQAGACAIGGEANLPMRQSTGRSDQYSTGVLDNEELDAFLAERQGNTFF